MSRAIDAYGERLTRQQITLDIRQAINSIDLANASIGAATQARDLARQNVNAENQKYELGSITAFELLDAQTRLASSESALFNAYVTYQQALREWVNHYNTGRPHQSLGPGIPGQVEQKSPTNGEMETISKRRLILAKSILGGLHHEYRWADAA